MAPSRKPLYFHFNPESEKFRRDIGQESEGMPVMQIKQPHTYYIEYSAPTKPDAGYAGTITIGYSITHPKDAFLKSIGRKKAEGRIKQLKKIFIEKAPQILDGIKQVKIHPDATKSLPFVIGLAKKIYQPRGNDSSRYVFNQTDSVTSWSGTQTSNQTHTSRIRRRIKEPSK